MMNDLKRFVSIMLTVLMLMTSLPVNVLATVSNEKEVPQVMLLSNEVSNGSVDLSRYITDMTVTPSSLPLPRNGGTITCHFEYEIPNDIKAASGTNTAYYDLPTDCLTYLTDAEGDIFDQGRTVGRYYLDKSTGRVTFTYDKSFYGGNSNITGFFNVKAEVKSTDTADSFVIRYSGSGTYTFDYEPRNITGSKGNGSGIYYKDNNFYQDYTITLTANGNISDAVVTDTLGANQSFVPGSWKVNGDRIADPAYSNGNSTATLSNLQLHSGNNSVTYTVKIDNPALKDGDQLVPLTNSFGVKWDNGTKIFEGYPFTQWTMLPSVSKQGFEFTGNEVSWKVDLNKGTYSTAESMGNAKYIDKLGNGIGFDRDAASIVVTDKSNFKVLTEGTDYTVTETSEGFEIQFSYTKADGSIPEYEIKYKTNVTTDIPTGGKVSNTGTFNHGGESYSRTAEATEKEESGESVRVPGTVSKSSYSSSYNDDGDMTVTWKVRITVPEDMTITKQNGNSNLKIIDSLGAWPNANITQYLPDTLKVSVNGDDITGCEMVYYGAFGYVYLPEGLELKQGQIITISYDTITPLSTAQNTGIIQFDVTNSVKVQWGNQYDESDDKIEFKHRTGNLTKTVEEQSQYSADVGKYVQVWHWTVRLNSAPDVSKGAMNLGNGPVYVTDYIPEGMTYVSGSAKYMIGYNTVRSIEPTSNGRILKFLLNEEIGQNFIMIEYWTRIDEGYLTGKGDVTFVNSASYADLDGLLGSGNALVTVNDKKTLDKTGAMNGTGNNVVYTITINEGSTDLDPASDTLELTDDLPNEVFYVIGSLSAQEGTILSQRYEDGKLYITPMPVCGTDRK